MLGIAVQHINSLNNFILLTVFALFLVQVILYLDCGTICGFRKLIRMNVNFVGFFKFIFLFRISVCDALFFKLENEY